mmetsp:Transcript_28465/g.40536  ORF Transcript_28465/g.40536 Transcript_28465/m.40536 type:complete len:97 (-) Transcript_28465:1212-1502(-)
MLLNFYFNGVFACRDAGVVSMMKELRPISGGGKEWLQDSRFFVTLRPWAAWADQRYSAFGRVTRGLEVLETMQLLPVQPPANYPLMPVRIVDSGCY